MTVLERCVKPMYHADIVIIGAGAVGLAVAAEVARHDRAVYVLEKNERSGLETSSRNSGVIHAGLYYPPGSLKASLCLEGNSLLYKICHEVGIGCRRLGKIVVAANDAESHHLEALYKNALDSGAIGLQWLSRSDLKRLEPNVEGTAGLFSPNTGIIDAHGLVNYFAGLARDRGATIVYRTEVTGVSKVQGTLRIVFKDTQGTASIDAKVAINCAGLYSDRIAAMAGIDVDAAGYRLYYCKGQYFSVNRAKSRLLKRLIFPVPKHLGPGIGVHVVMDLDGRMRLGPDAQYVPTIDYAVSDGDRKTFCDSVKPFLPFIDYDDLEPESAGIRPKLQKPGGPTRDFVICNETDRGMPGLINLIGIESPGLTAAPAIGRYVSHIVEQVLGN